MPDSHYTDKFQLLIGGRDYSSYVYSSLQQLSVKHPLNKPHQLVGAVLSEDMTFGGLGEPSIDEEVILNTSLYGVNTFKGFISLIPSYGHVGYKVISNFTASAGSTTTIRQAGITWPTDGLKGYNAAITSGPGVGKSSTVISNTSTTLTLRDTLSVSIGAGSHVILSSPIFGIKFTATSQEYQLNVKSAQLALLPTLQCRKTSDIIKTMTEFLLPGVFTYDIDEDVCNFQVDFEIKVGDVWSDLVAGCAVNDRAHYRCIDGVITYKAIGDDDLGAVYDLDTESTVTGWNVANMQVDPASQPITNDIIIVGDDAPKGVGKAFYVGDGYQGNFYLQALAYGIENNVIVNEDWSQGINDSVWETGPGDDAILPDTSNLQISGGDGVSSTYVRLLRAIELSGTVRLVHGEFQFGDPSKGIVGAVYKDFTALSDPLTSFVLDHATGFAGEMTSDQSPFKDGDTVTVGSLGYTFRTKVKVAFDVLIGENCIDSLTNLILAINNDGSSTSGEGQLFGIGTTKNDVEANMLQDFVIGFQGDAGFAVASSAAGFTVSRGVAGTPQTSITAQGGKSIITRDNHTYVLITTLHSRKVFPWQQKYASFLDKDISYGGEITDSSVFASLEVWDFDITAESNGGITTPITIVPIKRRLYDGPVDVGGLDNPFVAYVLFQAEDFDLAINFTELSYPFQALVETLKPVLDQNIQIPITANNMLADFPKDLNSLAVRSLGFGVDQSDATITADSSGNVVQFFAVPPSNIPVACELIQVFFNVLGRATGRVHDKANIDLVKAKYGDPDDGIRTQVIQDFVPPIRTDEDATNAASAKLADSVKPNYSCTYQVYCDYTTARPFPGRLLTVNERRFQDSPLQLLVSEVDVDIYGDHFTGLDKMLFTIKCGTKLDADKLVALLTRESTTIPATESANIKPVDILEVADAFLDAEIVDWIVESVQQQTNNYRDSNLQITITEPSTIPDGCVLELRKFDKGWGLADSSSNLIVSTTERQFQIPQRGRQQIFYMRFVSGTVSSRHSAYCKVGFPKVPVGLLNLAATVKDSKTVEVRFQIPRNNFQDTWNINLQVLQMFVSTDCTATTITDATQHWEIGALIGLTLEILSGPGHDDDDNSNNFVKIVDNDETKITIDSVNPFSVMPTKGTVFVLDYNIRFCLGMDHAPSVPGVEMQVILWDASTFDYVLEVKRSAGVWNVKDPAGVWIDTKVFNLLGQFVEQSTVAVNETDDLDASPGFEAYVDEYGYLTIKNLGLVDGSNVDAIAQIDFALMSIDETDIGMFAVLLSDINDTDYVVTLAYDHELGSHRTIPQDFNKGDYIIFNQPGHYEIGLITDRDDSTITVQRHPDDAPDTPDHKYDAYFGSKMSSHPGGEATYFRLFPKVFSVPARDNTYTIYVDPSNNNGGIPDTWVFPWTTKCVAAVVCQFRSITGSQGDPKVLNLADHVANTGQGAIATPGLRTSNGASYISLMVPGDLEVGSVSIAYASVSSWDAPRCITAFVGKPAVGDDLKIDVLYILEDFSAGSLLESLVIKDGEVLSYTPLFPPRNRQMPYFDSGYVNPQPPDQRWPPNINPLIPDLFENADGDVQTKPQPGHVPGHIPQVFASGGYIAVIVQQIGTTSPGTDLQVTVAT